MIGRGGARARLDQHYQIDGGQTRAMQAKALPDQALETIATDRFRDRSPRNDEPKPCLVLLVAKRQYGEILVAEALGPGEHTLELARAGKPRLPGKPAALWIVRCRQIKDRGGHDPWHDGG